MSVKGFAIICKGASKDLFAILEDSNGDPVDVSAATSIKGLFQREAGGTLLEINLISGANGIVTVENGREKIKLALTAVATALMKESEKGSFEVEAVVSAATLVWKFDDVLDVRPRLQP